ncbi:DUF502 domain-containing protein [Hazenella sp. IB182357]|uniref:DUF502 domain-containing protein n=1 Tax=Polycladospora coralii TaxID=2771432 RepID=A0A926RSZ9_9BACL|nr:DUF502 domain-containing protein [Polycladospora coralii]MBD1371023.1 DUF502 domain-containing protein [Polycladospora coralii]
MKRLSLYFFNGLLVILPLALTIYLLHYFFNLINGWGVYWLGSFPDQWKFPGIGMITIILFVLFVGFLTRIWVTKKLIDWIEGLIGRVPLVKSLFQPLKDTITSLFGEKKSFDTVVLVPLADSKRLGFLTVKTPIFNTHDGKEYVGVYFPQSMQFAGDLHWYLREQVEVIDITVDEALRILISAGVAKK